MAYVITDACTGCGLCLRECPIEAIHAGDPVYTIDDTCCDFTECVAICPEDAIVRQDDLSDADRRQNTNRDAA